jgi:hypothetical protein
MLVGTDPFVVRSELVVAVALGVVEVAEFGAVVMAHAVVSVDVRSRPAALQPPFRSVSRLRREA